MLTRYLQKVIANRIRGAVDFNQPNDQAWFRKFYSTIDHIHTINQVIEEYAKYNQLLHIAFIDYEKAFDLVETSAVIKALRNQGAEEPYIKILQDIIQRLQATIVIYTESNKIAIKKGVRQEDTIPPMLFSACLEEVFRALDRERLGYRVNGEYFSDLRFADDIVILINLGD